MGAMSRGVPIIGLVGVLLLCSQVTFAFDCDLVYDEFDSLMNKRFLLNPGQYVSTASQRLSRKDYNSKQKGRFLLRQERQGLGIAVFRTNGNRRGKLLYTWGRPVVNGQPSLIIKEAVLYGRVEDGHRPRRYRNLSVPSSFRLDLDTGRTGRAAADIWFHNVDGREMYIEAINGASIEFPLNSLCRPKLAVMQAISVVRPDNVTPQPASPPANDNIDNEPRVVKRELLANGHVLITYSDGSSLERFRGGQIHTASNGTKTNMSFSTAAPVAIPVAPPGAGEQPWLEFHRGYLLGIIQQMVDNQSLVEQFVNEIDNSGNVYQSINARAEIIQQLSLP